MNKFLPGKMCLFLKKKGLLKKMFSLRKLLSLRKFFSLLIALIIIGGLTTTYGCDSKLGDKAVKAILKNLTERTNMIFNIFYDPMEYDTLKEFIFGRKGNIFYPVRGTARFRTIANIKKECESVFTIEYLNRNLYKFGLNYIASEEEKDPVYIEVNHQLYVNSSAERFPKDMSFDYDTIDIKNQTENQIIINIDVLDYNYLLRKQATIKLEKVNKDWRISYLFK
jgi:hypothetical protein